MKILPILNQYEFNNAQALNKDKSFSYHKSPSMNFQTHKRGYCHLPFNISFGKKLNYDDFLNSLHKVYKNKSLKNIVLSSISDSNNFIGRGFSADVYVIPKIDDYLIRLERKKFTPQSFITTPIIPEIQNELAPNFGQFVATNNRGFFINKMVHGLSHSLPNWADKIKKVEEGVDFITYNDAKFISGKIRELSEFPQKSFDSLASNIDKLNKYTDCEIDIMNPNNLIIDNEQKTIGIIDLWYKHSDNGSSEPYNGVDSMINLMLDPFTHRRVFDKLNKREKTVLLDSSQKIIQKVFTASEKHGLERTNINAIIIYKDFDKHSNLKFAIPAYEDMLRLYPDLL